MPPVAPLPLDGAVSLQQSSKDMSKKKKDKVNIFKEFGMDKLAPVQEIEVNGVVLHKLNIGLYLRADHDIQRWKESLTDHTRFNRLLGQVRKKWRKPEEEEKEQKLRPLAEGQEIAPVDTSAAQQLKELQELLNPKMGKRKKQRTPMELDDTATTASSSKKQPSAESTAQLSPPSNTGLAALSVPEAKKLWPIINFVKVSFESFEAAFRRMDVHKVGHVSVTDMSLLFQAMGFDGDLIPMYRALRKGPASVISEEEFLSLQQVPEALKEGPVLPFLMPPPQYSPGRSDSVVSGSPGRSLSRGGVIPLGSSASAPSLRNNPGSRGSRRIKHQAQMPRTMVLMLFRNGDRAHRGEVFFHKSWPPPSMAEFLTLCGEACTPFIGPVTALMDLALCPIESLEEVIPGSCCLVKGSEGLCPPILFSENDAPPPVMSLRDAMDARLSTPLLPTPGPYSMYSTVSSTLSVPSSGSPPWRCSGQVRDGVHGKKWEVDSKLGMVISWGGLGHPHRHHLFETWERALGGPIVLDKA